MENSMTFMCFISSFHKVVANGVTQLSSTAAKGPIPKHAEEKTTHDAFCNCHSMGAAAFSYAKHLPSWKMPEP